MKCILFCNVCEKQWDNQAGRLGLSDWSVVCKECCDKEEAEKPHTLAEELNKDMIEGEIVEPVEAAPEDAAVEPEVVPVEEVKAEEVPEEPAAEPAKEEAV